ncbi:MAG: hypothetical protein WC289_01000 [Patescibacteria group bacterium]|jgi:coenzyme F420-reducing hydrogenase gamma subunit
MNTPTKTITAAQSAPSEKKLRIGWFTFSCCEDSTIVFTELLNDHWQDWKRLLDIRHARVLQTHNVLDELDVAFVEGALTSQEHIDKVKEIRQKSKKLVAIGACAAIGLPSAQRNQFDPARLEEIQPILARFAYLPRVLKLSDAVTVDVTIPGCPMDEKMFLKALTALLQEFHVGV